MSEKQIRIGVVGIGRGRIFAHGATDLLGMKLVALCDCYEQGLKQEAEYLKQCNITNVKTYTDYDKFLEHEMDAVMT